MQKTIYISKQRNIFPSFLVLMLFSHMIYYWNVLWGNTKGTKMLVYIALFFLMLGNIGGTFISPASKGMKVHEGGLKEVKKFGWICLLIGISSHLYFYGRNLSHINTYADRYLVTRGNGIFTGMFCGMFTGGAILEYCYSKGFGSKRERLLSRLCLFFYLIFYLFILSKRRQIIILFILLLVIYCNKISIKNKTLIYLLGCLVYVFLVVFGQCRAYMVKNGVNGIVEYALPRINIEWFSPKSLEGKYTSQILEDIYQYVQIKGHTLDAFCGAIMTIIPRKLLGGNKLENFTSWYTLTFHYVDYFKGAGYAGSTIAELYLLGGIVAVCIAYFVLGYICNHLNKLLCADGDKKTMKILVYGYFVYCALFFPRLDIGSFIVDACFILIPFRIAIYLSTVRGQ